MNKPSHFTETEQEALIKHIRALYRHADNPTPEQISNWLGEHGIDAPAEWVKEVIGGE